MISMFAAFMLQATAPPPVPPPPQPLTCKRGKACRARASIGSLISNDDYPKDALRNDEEGIVGFRVQVGADGLIKGCEVTASSGSASLDSATCRLLTERARFSPARNKRGVAVPDSVAARIVWRIDRESSLIPMAPSLMAVTMRVSPGGETKCSQFANMDFAEIECPGVADEQMVAAARTLGKTVEQTVVQTITPDGTAEPLDTVDRGTQVLGAEALLSVSANGSLVECRMLRNELLGPAAGHPSPSNPCEGMTVGKTMFHMAGGADRATTARLRIRLYIRK